MKKIDTIKQILVDNPLYSARKIGEIVGLSR